jgi:hypothetical protein
MPWPMELPWGIHDALSTCQQPARGENADTHLTTGLLLSIEALRIVLLRLVMPAHSWARSTTPGHIAAAQVCGSSASTRRHPRTYERRREYL